MMRQDDHVVLQLRDDVLRDPSAAVESVDVSVLTADQHRHFVNELLQYNEGRRWLRDVSPNWDDQSIREDVARILLNYVDDFDPSTRDRSTLRFVERLPVGHLIDHIDHLAGSNTASLVWERIWRETPGDVMPAAEHVMVVCERSARETMLYTLLLDPYGEIDLPDSDRLELLHLALDDEDEEVRGLAAELAMDETPATLLNWPDAPTDESERLRGAWWQVAFLTDLNSASERALDLIADDSLPLPARRSALLALGESAPTSQIADLLAILMNAPVAELAHDAADLLWRYHRVPQVAQAAAESQYPAIQEMGRQLLHPELGSPAAGGSRPGAENQAFNIYEQMRRMTRDE